MANCSPKTFKNIGDDVYPDNILLDLNMFVMSRLECLFEARANRI